MERKSSTIRIAPAMIAAGILFCAGNAGGSQVPDTLTAAQAGEHVGKIATVCDSVASTKYLSRSKGKPTFLNLAEPYPDHIFTVVIWGRNRNNFKPPPEDLEGKWVCASGRITTFRNVPQIEVKAPEKLKVIKRGKD